jgi:hypothetical protein
VALAARPGVFVLLVTLLAGLCFAWTCWQGSGRPIAATAPVSSQPAEPAELGLLADNSSPKLDNTSAAAPGPRAAVPKGDLDRKDAHVIGTPPPAPDAGPALGTPPPPPVEPVVVVPAAAEVPAENCYATRDALRGDTAMMNRWKLLGFQALLAAAVVTPAVPAADAPTEPDKFTALSKKIDDLKSTIQDLERTVKKDAGDLRADLEKTDNRVKAAAIDLDKMRTEIAQLRRDVDLLQKVPPTTQRESSYPSDRADLQELRRSIEALRQDVEALRRQPVNRVAQFGPGDGTARVRLINTFPRPMTIVVNGLSYDVNPGETRFTAPIPFGPFTYEVLGVQPRQTRTLAPSPQPFTIEVYPRAL